MGETAPHDAALVLVPTPIGNYGDLSPRAIAELGEADLIACEDTRRTGRLCKHFGIGHAPFLVCNEHSERVAAEEIISRVRRGERVVLVSDAGTPAISDPGQRVVEAAVAAGISVTALPGPSAAITAVSLSGFSTDRFCFEGFLPRKGSARTARLADLATETRTAVVFESPRRVRATIADLAEKLGGRRRVVVARELTKTFEELWRGSLDEAVGHFIETEPLGEFVLVIEGVTTPPATDEAIRVALRRELDSGSTTRDAVASVAAGFGVAKRRVYELALEL